MMSNHSVIMIILLCAVCALLSSIGGCSSSGGDSNVSYSGSEAAASPAPSSIYPPSAQVSAYYFPASLVEQMKSETAPIISSYNGMNVFSSAMYSKAFLVGTITVKDIFDARIPVNYEIFSKYAYDNFGIRLKPLKDRQTAFRAETPSPSPSVSPTSSPSPSPSPTPYYLRYAQAANQFIQQFEYDGILFRPDELHPIFTNPDTDTWLFLVDHPTNPADIYYSTRLQNRSIAITGGLAMRAMNSQDPLYLEDWMYYVPNEDVANYSPYVATTKAYGRQEKLVSATSNYVPADASAATIARRSQYGIVSSPLSGQTLLAGGWKNEKYINDMVNNGISFTNNPLGGTWGGWGLYLLPLDTRFWE
ncbi:MAG: hypothetical protein AB9903_11560 [Vulcanimicrobiota bacterium]